MKKIIFRKISNDCLKFFILTILSISLIIWVLQAVNFLDFVVEDGHGFTVYLNYTLLNFPKILSRLFPFTVFFSITYILLKYENNNELVIFWNIGIHKIEFINFFLKFSIIFLIMNLILNSFIVPNAQSKARSFLKSSDLDFFESILKPKTFIVAIKGLTIFFDEKNSSNELKNIFLKDNTKKDGFQITIAKLGKFESYNNRKVLVLYDGKTINKNKKISSFNFLKSDYNISLSNSKEEKILKIQENTTSQIFKCLSILKALKITNENKNKTFDFDNCRVSNLENIFEELYKRIIIPFYTPLIMMISLLIIMISKDSHNFKTHKIKVFIFGFLFIIFLEISLKFISTDILKNLFIFTLPVLLSCFMYIYFIKKLKNKNYENLS